MCVFFTKQIFFLRLTNRGCCGIICLYVFIFCIYYFVKKPLLKGSFNMRKVSGESTLKDFDLDTALQSEGESITFSACVHKIKKMGGFAFVILRTARYLIQSVHDEKSCPDSLDEIREGCYVTVSGTVKRMSVPITERRYTFPP